MSARNRRSHSAFPGGEIFYQRIAVAGPNATVVSLDIDLDLEDKRIIRILMTELGTRNVAIATSTTTSMAVSLNPDKADINTTAELNDDDLIHYESWEYNFTTSGGSHLSLASVRNFPEEGISYGQQRLRALCRSTIDLSGTQVTFGVAYRFDEVTTETALALLRRR